MSTLFEVPGITDPNDLAVLARTRKYKQYVASVADLTTTPRRCPFCDVNREHNKVITEDNPFWLAWPTTSPENNSEHHILFVPRRHVTDSEELSGAEWLALRNIRKDVRKLLGYTSRGFLIRDGGATLLAGTVQHLHAHDVAPNGMGRVEITIYKGPEDDEKDRRKAIVFEKIRQGTPIQLLTEDEYLLVKDRMG